MKDYTEEFDFEAVLEELNKKNEGKDVAAVTESMNEEMEAASKRVEEYILKHSEK